MLTRPLSSGGFHLSSCEGTGNQCQDSCYPLHPPTCGWDMRAVFVKQQKAVCCHPHAAGQAPRLGLGLLPALRIPKPRTQPPSLTWPWRREGRAPSISLPRMSLSFLLPLGTPFGFWGYKFSCPWSGESDWQHPRPPGDLWARAAAPSLGPCHCTSPTQVASKVTGDPAPAPTMKIRWPPFSCVPPLC